MGYVQRFLQDIQETKRAAAWCRESGIAPTTFSAIANGARDPSPDFAEKLLKTLDEDQIPSFLIAYLKDCLPEEFHHRFQIRSSRVKEDSSSKFGSSKLESAKAYLMKRCEKDPLLAEHLVSLVALVQDVEGGEKTGGE